MVEFNKDGSLKLPEILAKSKRDKEYRLTKGRCLLINKQVVSDKSPKKCVLRLTLSNAISDNQFVENTYKYYNEKAEVPSKISKINEKEFEVTIGTHFKRCSDCTKLIDKYRDFLDDNVILEKGSCTFESRSFESKNFSYEDYFD